MCRHTPNIAQGLPQGIQNNCLRFAFTFIMIYTYCKLVKAFYNIVEISVTARELHIRPNSVYTLVAQLN